MLVLALAVHYGACKCRVVIKIPKKHANCIIYQTTQHYKVDLVPLQDAKSHALGETLHKETYIIWSWEIPRYPDYHGYG